MDLSKLKLKKIVKKRSGAVKIFSNSARVFSVPSNSKRSSGMLRFLIGDRLAQEAGMYACEFVDVWQGDNCFVLRFPGTKEEGYKFSFDVKRHAYTFSMTFSNDDFLERFKSSTKLDHHIQDGALILKF